MERQVESWQLRSGTWHRDPQSERWRLAAASNGTIVSDKLSPEDMGRMLAGSRDAASGQWFPSDFSYSPQTGTRLQITIPSLDSAWVPPCGAAALSENARSFGRGLKQTATPLSLVRSKRPLDATSEADRKLPSLPPGHYLFLVHKFDVASPALLAIEPQQGRLLVLLPESKTWIVLEPAGAELAAGPANRRGWRMEAIESGRRATLYFPTVRGLAALTPTLIGLSYAVEYFGNGAAIGAPVAWGGETWLPVLTKEGAVNLVGKPRGSAEPLVLKTSAPVPKNGFEAPVFDLLHVIWPSDEGQLVLRLDQGSRKKCDWVAWPDGLKPVFSLGCPYPSLKGSFLQQCWRGQHGSLEYVEMATPVPDRNVIDAPRLSTGQVSWRGKQRITGDPWRDPGPPVDESSQVLVPLIESEHERAVVGLGMDAPHGVLALLASQDKQRAVLQLHADHRDEMAFGTLEVAMPWLACVFVYDAHLWLHHPELAQPLGWKLFD